MPTTKVVATGLSMAQHKVRRWCSVQHGAAFHESAVFFNVDSKREEEALILDMLLDSFKFLPPTRVCKEGDCVELCRELLLRIAEF